MNLSPIPRVLSILRRHRVRALLMGGQACIVADGVAGPEPRPSGTISMRRVSQFGVDAGLRAANFGFRPAKFLAP